MRSVGFHRTARACACSRTQLRAVQAPGSLVYAKTSILLGRQKVGQGSCRWRHKATAENDHISNSVTTAQQHVEPIQTGHATDAQLLAELEALPQEQFGTQEGAFDGDWVAGNDDFAVEPVVEHVVETTAPQVGSEEYESEEVEHESLTPAQMLSRGVEFVQTNKYAQAGGVGLLALLLATFGLAAFRTYQKYQSARAKRKRQVDKNKELVEELAKFLPGNQASLTSSKVQGLQRQVGFSMVEMFRKYLWYLLQSRTFDETAVNDVVHLKRVMGLTDDDVAEALKERAQRIYNKYGTLMLNTEGMTDEGVQRKATCKALFQKLLYLTELEMLITQDSEAAKKVNLREIFGATEEDVDGLRLVSLVDVDMDKLDRMATSGPGSFGDDDEPISSPARPPAPKPQK